MGELTGIPCAPSGWKRNFNETTIQSRKALLQRNNEELTLDSDGSQEPVAKLSRGHQSNRPQILAVFYALHPEVLSAVVFVFAWKQGLLVAVSLEHQGLVSGSGGHGAAGWQRCEGRGMYMMENGLQGSIVGSSQSREMGYEDLAGYLVLVVDRGGGRK